MEKEMISIALLMILIVTGVQIALAPNAVASSHPEINTNFQLYPNLGEEFSLFKGQSASITLGQSEVDAGYVYTINLANVAGNECVLQNQFDKCPEIHQPVVALNIKGTQGFLSEGPQFPEYDINLFEGQKTIVGEKPFSIEIENTHINSSNNTATFVVSALSTDPAPVPEDIFVGLGREFSLLTGQKAIVENENIKIRLDNTSVSYCTAALCVGAISTAYITVFSQSGSDETGSIAIKEIPLEVNESTEVFGYKITNTFIESKKAGFQVTKPSSNPKDLLVGFGEKFFLTKGQTAKFVKDNANVAKLVVQYFDISKCALDSEYCNANFAVVSFTGKNGTTNDFLIKENEKTEILGSYVIYLEEINFDSEKNGKAGFIVYESSPPIEEKIEVFLDEPFDLLQKQTGFVRETGFEIQFLDWSELPCPTASKKCEFQATFLVKQNDYKSLSDNKNEIKTTDSNLSFSTKISVKEGSSKEIFGHTVALNEIVILSTINAKVRGEPTNSFSSATANLTVSKTKTPKVVNAKLDSKFYLEEKQTALISKSNGSTAMKVYLDKIENYKCGYEEEVTENFTKKCYQSPYARVTAAVSGEESASFNLTEGSTRYLDGYKIRLLDIDLKQKQAVFTVSEVLDDFLSKVSLNEKFGLKEKQTALVEDIDLFIRLNDIVILKSFPPQYKANVSVWKNVESKTVLQEYQISQGETINLFGAKIELKSLDADRGIFVVTAKKDPQLINVLVGDPFWLKESQSARVIPANLQIDLRNISYVDSCRPFEAYDSDSNIIEYVKPCELAQEVEIGVSSYLFEKTTIGQTVSGTAVEKFVVESTEEVANSFVLPPTPFKIFTLREGEEVTVNDYSIRVLTTETGNAEFVVKNKVTGDTVEYKIFQGWNLFSMPGELEVEKSTCNTSNWKLFEYNNKNNAFKKVIKPVEGHAYWLFNPDAECRVKAEIRSPVRLSEIPALNKNWNFVAPTFDMVGREIKELGDCKIERVLKWNPQRQIWINYLDRNVKESDIGEAFAVYSLNNCSLSEGILSPPSISKEIYSNSAPKTLKSWKNYIK